MISFVLFPSALDNSKMAYLFFPLNKYSLQDFWCYIKTNSASYHEKGIAEMSTEYLLYLRLKVALKYIIQHFVLHNLVTWKNKYPTVTQVRSGIKKVNIDLSVSVSSNIHLVMSHF